MSLRQLIPGIVALAGGEITGRVRLQKIIYLLDRKGLGSGASFSYHHYGPFSRTVDEAIVSAKASEGLCEKTRHRASDGAPFSIFVVSPDLEAFSPEHLGNLRSQDVKNLLANMNSVSSTVIELAATIDWLRDREGLSDWRPELIRRKGAKTQGGRIQEAERLLQSIGL